MIFHTFFVFHDGDSKGADGSANTDGKCSLLYGIKVQWVTYSGWKNYATGEWPICLFYIFPMFAVLIICYLLCDITNSGVKLYWQFFSLNYVITAAIEWLNFIFSYCIINTDLQDNKFVKNQGTYLGLKSGYSDFWSFKVKCIIK